MSVLGECVWGCWVSVLGECGGYWVSVWGVLGECVG